MADFNPFESNWTYQAELEAVNDILGAIGESPVNTLDGDANVDVVNARRILAQVNRLEQARGWTFNIEEDAVLTPDVYSGLIPFMNSYLRLDGPDGTNYMNRSGYVYDKTNKTDRFTGPITVNLIELKTFDEMPEVFKRYIVTKAAKKFNIQFFGDGDVDTTLSNDLIDLTHMINEYELDYGGFNAFQDPYLSSAIQR